MNLRRWPRLTFTGLLMIFVLAVAGCGSKQPPASSSASSPKDIGGVLQLYTSQPDADATKLVEAFKKKYPQVQVNVFRSGTEEVIARINTEVRAGKLGADVMLLADAPTFETLKEKGLLLAYQSPETKDVNQELLDPDNMYSPTKMIPTGIVVNTNKVKDLAGIDWNTLIAPQSKSKAVMPSPLYSGAAAYNLGVFRNQQSLGWPYYEKLKDNDVMVVKGNGDVIKRVASGERDFGIIVDFMAHNAKQQGSPVAFVYPKSGVAVITEPVGIAKTAQNVAAAQAFVDFVLSSEGQNLAVSLGYLPVKAGVPVPPGRPSPESLKILYAPVKKLVEQREPDKKDFSTVFGG
ncbi:MAG TPA: ABC transporter substrate-binding protein [Negativicutes bacterium]